jgi:hypothetical protein
VKYHCHALLAVRFVVQRDRVVRDLPKKVDSLPAAVFAGRAIEGELAASYYSVFDFQGLPRRVAQTTGDVVACNFQIEYGDAGSTASLQCRCPTAAGIIG